MMVYIIADEANVSANLEWSHLVKGLLKAELKRRSLSYKQLTDKLKILGIDETERNITNKISRGGFSAVFFIQCLKAIGCKSLNLDD